MYRIALSLYFCLTLRATVVVIASSKDGMVICSDKHYTNKLGSSDDAHKTLVVRDNAVAVADGMVILWTICPRRIIFDVFETTKRVFAENPVRQVEQLVIPLRDALTADYVKATRALTAQKGGMHEKAARFIFEVGLIWISPDSTPHFQLLRALRKAGTLSVVVDPDPANQLKTSSVRALGQRDILGRIDAKDASVKDLISDPQFMNAVLAGQERTQLTTAEVESSLRKLVLKNSTTVAAGYVSRDCDCTLLPYKGEVKQLPLRP